MTAYTYVILSVTLPLILLALFGAKPILIKSTWLVASALLITSGIMFIGSGGFAAVCGVLFVLAGFAIAVVAIWSYLRLRVNKAGERTSL